MTENIKAPQLLDPQQLSYGEYTLFLKHATDDLSEPYLQLPYLPTLFRNMVYDLLSFEKTNRTRKVFKTLALLKKATSSKMQNYR